MLAAWKFIVLSRYFQGPSQQGWKFSQSLMNLSSQQRTRESFILRGPFTYLETHPNSPRRQQQSQDPCCGSRDRPAQQLRARQSPFNGAVPTPHSMGLSLWPWFYLHHHHGNAGTSSRVGTTQRDLSSPERHARMGLPLPKPLPALRNGSWRLLNGSFSQQPA